MSQPNSLTRAEPHRSARRPIGMFDSGIGGLTVLHECLVAMPAEDFVYVGDTARFPYGPKTPGRAARCSPREIAAYLDEAGVKLLVVACYSATAAALPALQEQLLDADRRRGHARRPRRRAELALPAHRRAGDRSDVRAAATCAHRQPRRRRRGDPAGLSRSGRVRPIGMFDSGIGGLTVLHECLVAMPAEDFVYVGDTARFPYGAKSQDELRLFARQIATFLDGPGVKLLVVACYSATAAALPALQEQFSTPIVGVVMPGARAAVQTSRYRRIGVLATEATVASGSYVRAIGASTAAPRSSSRPAPASPPSSRTATWPATRSWPPCAASRRRSRSAAPTWSSWAARTTR